MNKIILICISILILIILLKYCNNKETYQNLYWWESTPAKNGKIIDKDYLREQEDLKKCGAYMYKELAVNPDSDLDQKSSSKDKTGIYKNYILNKYDDDEINHTVDEMNKENIQKTVISHIKGASKDIEKPYVNPYIHPNGNDTFKLEDYYKLQLLKKTPIDFDSKLKFDNKEIGESYYEGVNKIISDKNYKELKFVKNKDNKDNKAKVHTSISQVCDGAPYGKDLPKTCWGNSVYHKCKTNKQEAYNYIQKKFTNKDGTYINNGLDAKNGYEEIISLMGKNGECNIPDKQYKLEENQEDSVYYTTKDITSKRLNLENIEYNDLFGIPTGKKEKTDFVLSQGYPYNRFKNERKYDLRLNNKKIQTFKCKKCPLPIIQNYLFRLSDDMMRDIQSKDGEAAAKLRDNKYYFVEKGGTYFKDDKCKLCSYQQGCFYPRDPENEENKTDIRKMYQESGCGIDTDRVCKDCDTCDIGRQYIQVFCGEGGGHQNTVCGTCRECDFATEFKKDGCRFDETTKNSVCIKKSTCYGLKSDLGNREYSKNDEIKDGNASYEDTPGFPGGFIDPNNEEGVNNYLNQYKEANNLDENDKYFKDVESKIKSEDYKKEGYLGENRKCKPCTPCGKNELNIGGCEEDNSKSDTVCVPFVELLSNVELYAESLEPLPGEYHDNEELVDNYIRKNIEIRNEILKEGGKSTLKDFLKDKYSSYSDEKIQKLLDNFKNISETDYIDRIKAFVIKNNPDIKLDLINKIVENIKKESKKTEPFVGSGTPGTINTNRYSKLSIRDIISKDCKKISDAPAGTYVDLNDPGCDGKIDTKFIPHSVCKGFGKPPDSESQRIIKKGTQTSDVECGPCRCPDGFIGPKPKCNGSNLDNDIPIGCTKNVLCKNKEPQNISPSETKIIGIQEGQTNPLLYTYDKPKLYGDTTRQDRCKVCDTRCPQGSFQLEPCDPERSTNIVCKDHTICDPETQIAIQQGDQLRDTICQCIDGYEVHKDENDIPDYSKPCQKIKGKCWENPCHEQALCYDNFNTDPITGEKKFVDFNCVCDIKNNWIETENQGVGSKGCTKIETTHGHTLTETPKLSRAMENDYRDLLHINPKVFNVLAHTHGIPNSEAGSPVTSPQFHYDLLGHHIHK